MFLIFSAVLNVLLDLLLIIHFKMGVAGAGYATVFSQGISAVLCLFYIYRSMPDMWPENTTGSFMRQIPAISSRWAFRWHSSLPSPHPVQ